MRRKINFIRKLVIPIVIFLVLVGIFFLFDFLISIGKYKIFAFSSDEYFLYQESNKGWFSISKEEFLEKYSKLSYNLYVSGVNRGNYKFKMIDDKLEMIKASNGVINRFSDNWIAYSGKSKISYIKFKSDNFNIDDEKRVFKQLKSKGLVNTYNITYGKKYVLDIDDDNSNEFIYIISNMVDYKKNVTFSVNDKMDKAFSFMFLVDNGKFYDIYTKISDIKGINEVCLPTFEGALLFNRDNSRKIISYCEYLSNDSYELNLYNYKNSKISNININS